MGNSLDNPIIIYSLHLDLPTHVQETGKPSHVRRRLQAHHVGVQGLSYLELLHPDIVSVSQRHCLDVIVHDDRLCLVDHICIFTWC